MAGGSRCRHRRSWVSWIRRRRGGSKLSSHGGGDDDILVKPDNLDYGECICLNRIKRRGRMRVGANGGLYVVDSEDEEAVMEIDAGSIDLADLGGASVTSDAITVGADGVMGHDVDQAAKDIPADAEEGDGNGVKVEDDTGTSEEMHPKVVARLKILLDLHVKD